MKVITFRLVFERAVVLAIRDEPEFRNNLSLQAQEIKPTSDHYLAIFVFTLDPRDGGVSSLRVVSTTVAGIQRYTTTRLRYQGIYLASSPDQSGILVETLRAHYRASAEDTRRRMESTFGPPLPYWAKHCPNGAGDLVDPLEFVIHDPELAELEKLFSSDAREENESGGEES